MKYDSGEQFINKLYNNLINEEEVKRSIRKSDSKISNREDMLKTYFDRLEEAHDITSDRKLGLLKLFYYDKYVIKELPEDYVELQKRIARERGYGDIDVTKEMKNKMLEELKKEQKSSLDSWLNYLTNKDAMYPMWFKYYAFQGMVKLGKFDKEKGEFTKRTNSTVTPFIEINPEILGQMYNILSKTINKEELTEQEEQALSNGESFKKLYKYFLVGNYKENENKEETKGVWIKYEQGNNYKELWESLQGKNTGWCTAGEGMCRSQIKNGDFYVYYTYDKESKPTNPRIAIRMDGKNTIGEIRGIDSNQNLEAEMLPILKEKLNEFPDKDKYLKKEHDMTLLTKIDNKVQNKEELTKEEIKFLYEIDSKIEGFGWQKDPRVEQIRKKRNKKKDLFKCFEGEENAIATSYDEINNNTKAVFYNDKVIFNSEDINELKVSKEICLKENNSELTKEEIEYLYGIKQLKYSLIFRDNLQHNFYDVREKRNIKKDLSKYFECDENAIATCEKEINLNTIIAYIDNEVISLNELQKYKELLKIYNSIKTEKIIKEEYKTIVKKYEGYYTFRAIKKMVSKLKLLFDGNNIAKSHGILFENVAWTEKDLVGKNNVLMYIGDLKIKDIKVPDYLKNLRYVYGNVDFSNLKSAKGLENLRRIYGTANFESLTSGDGLCSLQEVYDELVLSNLKDIGNMNQKVKITPRDEIITYDAYSPPIILSEGFFTSENIANIKSNTRFANYLVKYYGDFYQNNSNVTFRRIYNANQKELEKALNAWEKEDAMANEENLLETNNLDYSSYRNIEDLIDFFERNGEWPVYINNPLSNEDYINNELYEYRQELLAEEDYLDDDIRERLLDKDPSFFDNYIY